MQKEKMLDGKGWKNKTEHCPVTKSKNKENPKTKWFLQPSVQPVPNMWSSDKKNKTASKSKKTHLSLSLRCHQPAVGPAPSWLWPLCWRRGSGQSCWNWKAPHHPHCWRPSRNPTSGPVLCHLTSCERIVKKFSSLASGSGLQSLWEKYKNQQERNQLCRQHHFMQRTDSHYCQGKCKFNVHTFHILSRQPFTDMQEKQKKPLS